MERKRARPGAVGVGRSNATPETDAAVRAPHPASTPALLLALQGAAGNQAVRRLLSGDGPEDGLKLPPALRRAYEAAGGVNLNDVRVHADSGVPRQHGALAMAQGTDIHLAPGHGDQLGHETWHVVQQKQGRVQPTSTDEGTSVNDNPALESEADTAGAQPSTKLVSAEPTDGKLTAAPRATQSSRASAVAQFAAKVKSLTVTHTSTSETETTASHRFDIRSELKEESPDWDFRQDIKGFWTLNGKPQTLKSSGSGATISKDSWSDDGYTKADNTSSDPKVFETNDNPGGGFEKNKKEDYFLQFRARMIDPDSGKNLKTKSGYWIRITGKYPRKFDQGGFD